MSGYLAIAAGFAAAYGLSPCAVLRSDATCADSAIGWWEYLSFSLITQSTLGYGNIIPESRLGHLLVGLQIVTGLVFTGLFVGAIVTRALTPDSESLLASRNVAFNPETGHFSLRLINLLNMDMFYANARLLVIRKREGDGLVNRKPVLLVVDTVSHFASRWPTQLRTKPPPSPSLPDEEKQPQELPDALSPQTLEPITLANGQRYGAVRELRLMVSASTALGQVNRLIVFPRESIICGTHVSTWDEATNRFDLSKFDEVRLTDQNERCHTCQWNAHCGLRDAKTTTGE